MGSARRKEWQIHHLSSNNVIIDKNEKIENFEKHDKTGVGMTVMAMTIVFLSLLILSLCFIDLVCSTLNLHAARSKPQQALSTTASR